MDGHGDGDCQDRPKLQDHALGEIPTRSDVFDALQYDFFGGDAVEEFELGGLEDEEDSLNLDGFEEEEFQSDKEEGDFLGIYETDDLSSTFSKLSKTSSGPTNGGVSRGWGSRESSSASDLTEDPALGDCFDPRAYDAKTISESQKWTSHAYSSPSAYFMEPNSFHMTSSHPEQHPQQPQNLRRQYSSEELIIPNLPFTSHPSHGGRFHQASPVGPSNIRIFEPNPQLSQFSHHLPLNSRIQNQLPNQNILYPWNDPGFPTKLPPLQNSLGLPPPDMMPPLQTRMSYTFQPSNLEMPGSSKHHLIPRYPRPRFRSKYMTSSEIENIHRAHLAATHSNDPYSDDYYHQAIMARKAAEAKLRHHFCPTNLSDGSSSSSSATNEPRPFLQVDDLGRVCFSSIHRPRPLLEVEKSNGGGKIKSKPLEHEQMLAVRAVIEDGMRILLEVDDIDRFLEFNDGGAQLRLRQRRQILLEGLAKSLLHLVDPLGKNGRLEPRDNLVFLAVISLCKGKKLLSRYLMVLLPGELLRVVCMAICRNLRSIFCNMASDNETYKVTQNLVKNVSCCVRVMDLKSVAACLSSACVSELPYLGHSDGDGASLILQSMLERAHDLMRDPYQCSVGERDFWQASFDVFFTLVIKYCFRMYGSVLQSHHSHGIPDVAEAVGREIPIVLLRASLPHTSDEQRKVVLEFVQRNVPVRREAPVLVS